jgi:4-amino-4-deoxy-L-arabinose transferase-like glycosyltransferase
MSTSDRAESSASPRAWRTAVIWSVALILLTIATRLPLLRLTRPIDDEVVYAVVAQRIVEGGQPYLSAVERKPPLLFYVYAATLKVFGPSNWRALHGVEVGWILLTMAGLFVMGRRLFDADTGLIAALFYSIFQAWSYWNNLAFNGEVLMNLPIVWACAIAVKPRRSQGTMALLGAGMLLATGFLLKQPAAIAAVPLGLYLLRADRQRCRGRSSAFAEASADRRSLGGVWSDPPDETSFRYRSLASLAIGFISVVAAVAVWLGTRGLLAEAFYWTITNHDIPRIFWGSALGNTIAFVSFCLPITLGAWVSCRRSDIWSEKHAERGLLVGWAIASGIGAASSGRFYPHYYIAAVPPCALLAAPLFARIWRTASTDRWSARLTQAWLVATVAVFAVAHTQGLARHQAETKAGRYLREHASADDRIFVWGQATQIYIDAERRPATRYIATFPLTGLIFGAPPPVPGDHALDTRARIVPGSWEKLREDFAAHEPTFVVDAEVGRNARYPVQQFPAMDAFLAAAYVPVATTDEGVIYKRRPETAQTRMETEIRQPASGN